MLLKGTVVVHNMTRKGSYCKTAKLQSLRTVIRTFDAISIVARESIINLCSMQRACPNSFDILTRL